MFSDRTRQNHVCSPAIALAPGLLGFPAEAFIQLRSVCPIKN
jgi:hypothetical protein